MARSYKRDKNGRFAGGGGGGKLGKSAKNEAARAKYKAAASNARSAEKAFGGNSPAAGTKFGKRQVAGAKSGLTRVTQNLRGGAKGNLGASTNAAGPKRAAGGNKASGMSNQVAAGRAAKAAYQSKAASKRKAKVAKAGGSFTKTSTFRNSLKGKQATARNAKKAAKK